MDEPLVIAVSEAIGRPEVHHAITAIYRQVQRAVDERQPHCSASGRCCRFDEYGHRLFVTTAELATFIASLRDAPPDAPNPRSLPQLADKGSCRFQRDRLCTVHAIRPFGCRMFYCDPTATDWQQQQYERFHDQLKQLHKKFAIPYFYMEWRSALSAVGSLFDYCSAP